MSPDRTVQEYLVRIHDYRKGLLREDDLAVACVQHRCCTHSSRLEACTFYDYSLWYWFDHCVSCDTSHTKEIAKHLQEMSRAQVSDLLRWAPSQRSRAWMRCCARLGMWSMLRQYLRHLAGIKREHNRLERLTRGLDPMGLTSAII
jgi:hypothetical protein